jgi:hypothetical protein
MKRAIVVHARGVRAEAGQHGGARRVGRMRGGVRVDEV